MDGVIIIAPIDDSEVIIVEGGDRGPPGPSGEGAAFVHTQASALTEWIINHNLGSRPFVTVLSTGGVEVEASVTHVTTNQLRINFATPQAGTARCL